MAATASFAFPAIAEAWGDRAHNRIAELALEILPPDQQGRMMQHKKHLLLGATEFDPEYDESCGNMKVSTDIQELMLAPHEGADLTRYFVYRMGVVSRPVANCALPLACSSAPSEKAIRRKFENDIESFILSFKAESLSPSMFTYPSTFLGHVLRETRLLEDMVIHTYKSESGFEDLKNDVVNDSTRRAVEAVASVWMTILRNEPAPMAMPSSQRLNYYFEQIRFSSAGGYFDDLRSTFRWLESENRRIPLTPTLIGDEFFKLPYGPEANEIYKIAMRVDPQSSQVTASHRSCKQHILEHPEQEEEEKKKEEPPRRRKLPRYLYGQNGAGPEINVYQHTSGLLLFTSKVKDVGSDYVMLNFDPITKIKKRTVVRTITSEPGTEEFDLEKIIRTYAREYDLSPALVKAVIKAESDFNPYVVSSAGASGLMQLMPSTALEMEVDDIFDPIQNIGGGVQYLARMHQLFNGDVQLALAAYNAGPGNVLKYGGIPPFRETRKYVPRVMRYYEQYRDDPKPVRLRVALRDKPAVDYLPEVTTIEEEIVEEETIQAPPAPQPVPSKDYVTIVLLNGRKMRGKAYKKTENGIRLELLDKRGWIVIREEHIARII